MFTNHKQNGRPNLVRYAELILGSELCKPRFRYIEIVQYADMSNKSLCLMIYFPKALWGYLGDYYKFLEYNILHLHDTLITIET